MSLIILTKDQNHLGGVFCGFHSETKSIFSGETYIGATIGVSTTSNSDRVQNFFETHGNLNGVHVDDILVSGSSHGRQYAFMTQNGFFTENSGQYAPLSTKIENSTTLLIGNTLTSGTTTYQDMFESISNSNESVKEKLIDALKTHKINGLDRRITNQSCYCVKLLVIDFTGNVIDYQNLYSKTEDPIDLLN